MPQFPHLQDVVKDPSRNAGVSWAHGRCEVRLWAGSPTWLPLASEGSSSLSLREASSTLPRWPETRPWWLSGASGPQDGPWHSLLTGPRWRAAERSWPPTGLTQRGRKKSACLGFTGRGLKRRGTGGDPN